MEPDNPWSLSGEPAAVARATAALTEAVTAAVAHMRADPRWLRGSADECYTLMVEAQSLHTLRVQLDHSAVGSNDMPSRVKVLNHLLREAGLSLDLAGARFALIKETPR